MYMSISTRSGDRIKFVEQCSRVEDGTAVDAVRGQRTLDQRYRNARIFDDENAILLRLVVLDEVKNAVEHQRRSFFLRDGQIDARAHQRDDDINRRMRTQIDQLAAGTARAHRSNVRVIVGMGGIVGIAGRRDEEHSRACHLQVKRRPRASLDLEPKNRICCLRLWPFRAFRARPPPHRARLESNRLPEPRWVVPQHGAQRRQAQTGDRTSRASI